MSRRRVCGLGLVVAAGIWAGPSAVVGQARLSVVESKDVDIVFPGTSHEFLVPHTGATLANALDFHRALYDWEPTGKPTVFLNDFSDFGSGSANTVPHNSIQFGVAPFSYTYETLPAIDRMFWLANHEVAHLATMDQATKRDRKWRRFFGGKVSVDNEDPLSIYYNYLTNPRWNAPRWYHEGIAVFLETWMAGGLGRALGAYDEMVFRTMVLDDAYFYDSVGLESEGVSTDFQTGANAYLYGTRFMTYLAYVHGPDKLIEWTGRKEGSKAYFTNQFQHVYGVSLREEWQRWIEFERRWQTENLSAIRENPTTPSRPLASTGLGSVSRAFVDVERGRIHVAVRYPGQVAHLAAIDLETGSIEKIRDLKGPATYYVTSIAYDIDNQVIFYTSDNYEWRDLWMLELQSGVNRRLANDLRLGDLAFNRQDRSLWGIQHVNGSSVLVRVPFPYDGFQEVHRFPYGSDLYDIDVSPDGTLVTGGMARADGSQSLVRFEMDDLADGRVEAEVLFDFGDSLASNFTFTPDGLSLYGSSYYSGVSNIFRFDLEKNEMFVVSNAETGLFRPQRLGEGELLAFRYTGEGFVPVAIPDRDIETVSAVRFLGTALAEKRPEVTRWRVDSPSTSSYEVGETEPYPTLLRMRLDHFQPVIEGYKDSVAVGMRFDWADALGQTRLKLVASIAPDSDLEDDELLHLDVELDHWKWNFRGTLNRTDFYDLFGPTKTSRRGHSLGYSWSDTLIYDDPRFLRLETGATYWGDLETLPNYQQIAAPSEQLLNGWAKLDYTFVQRSLGAVDDEKGIEAGVRADLDLVEDSVIPLLLGTFNYGFQLPIDHSSVWLRTATGYAHGEIDDPFANFFFGGFGNNYVDHQEVKRYREWYSFPGAPIDSIAGRGFVKTLAEWDLPPIRFRRVGGSQLYLNWARPALFAGFLRTNPDRAADSRTFSTLGAQIDFKMVLFSNLPSYLSFGYAVARESGGATTDEIMVSLKIL